MGTIGTNIEINYKHSIGSHCISTAMMGILGYYGIEMSEEMILGIGGGLGFAYVRGIGMDSFLVFGRSDDLEINLCSILNMQCRMLQDDNPEIAWEGVLRQLHQKRPVMIDTTVSKLNYLKQHVNWPNTSRHGGHKLIIVGYNEETEIVKLHDYAWQKPIYISKSELFRAWDTADENMPISNFYYDIDMPRRLIPIEEAIKNGIRLNTIRMKAPRNKCHGLISMRDFLREVPNWEYLINEEKRRRIAYATYVSLEVAGTGKGCFRRMYSRFLKEAAEILNDERLYTYSKDYMKVARSWSEVANLLKEGSENPKGGIFAKTPGVESLLTNLYKEEERLINALTELAITWMKGA